MSDLSLITNLFILALPIASIVWTVTHEEIFREPRDFCVDKSKSARSLFWRKFYYLFTCEYCFSHYVTAVFLVITQYHLLYDDWRGYLVAGFALVWVANVYISLFSLIRFGMKGAKMNANIGEIELEKKKSEVEQQSDNS